MQAAFFRQIDTRSPTPAIRDQLRNLARSGAGDSVQTLVSEGLVRLTDSMLIRRLQLMSLMLERTDESICAALSRGTPGNGQMTLAMAKLEGQDMEDWSGLLIEAQIATLERRKVRGVTPEVLAQSVQATIASLPDSEATRLRIIFSRFQTASDAEACWAGRALFARGAALPEPTRSHLALGLVQP